LFQHQDNIIMTDQSATTMQRTTLAAAYAALLATLRENLVADPPTQAAPFRTILDAAALAETSPRPYLATTLEQAEVVSAVSGDKIFSVTVRLRVAVDAVGEDAASALLSRVAAVEDHLDSLQEAGLLPGAEGADIRDWSFAYPKTTAGARLLVAEAIQTFIVVVARQQNGATA
jgi:hypothetical protein